jgi:hypothetical protein
MMIRRTIGLVSLMLALYAIWLAADGLMPGVRDSLAYHSWGMATGPLVNAALMLFVASLMARVAYRNLFWTRFLASEREKRSARTLR